MATRVRPQLDVRPRCGVMGRPLALSSSRRFHQPPLSAAPPAASSSSSSSAAATSSSFAYERSSCDSYRLGVGVGLSFDEEEQHQSASSFVTDVNRHRSRYGDDCYEDEVPPGGWRGRPVYQSDVRHSAAPSSTRSFSYLRPTAHPRTGGVYVKQEVLEDQHQHQHQDADHQYEYSRQQQDLRCGAGPFARRGFVPKEEPVAGRDFQQYPYDDEEDQELAARDLFSRQRLYDARQHEDLQPPVSSRYHNDDDNEEHQPRHFERRPQLQPHQRPTAAVVSSRLRLPSVADHQSHSKLTPLLREEVEEYAPQHATRRPTTTSDHRDEDKALEALQNGDDVAPKKAKKKRKRRICTREGCDKYVVDHGLCIGHGGGKRCYIEGCGCRAQNHGLCWKHGGYTICLAAGCKKRAKSRGVCWNHGGGTKCKEDGCVTAAVSHGLCWAHGGGRRCVVAGCQKLGYKKNGDLCIRHFAQHNKTGSSSNNNNHNTTQ